MKETMKNIIYVDDDMNFTQKIQNEVQTEMNFETTNDIEKLFNNLEKYDYIFLDIIMPNIDGLEILKKIKEIDPEKVVILISGHFTPYEIACGKKYQADYFIAKPFRASKLIKTVYDFEENLVEIRRQRHNDEMFEKIEAKVSSPKKFRTIADLIEFYLTKYGFDSSLSGFRYLRDAIMHAVEKGDENIMITKDIYPDIAERYRVSVTTVEKNIRKLIEKYCERQSLDELFEFLNMKKELYPHPTNSELVCWFAKAITNILK